MENKDFRPSGKCDSCGYSPITLKKYKSTTPASERWICNVCAQTYGKQDTAIIRWGINYILLAIKRINET